MPVKAENQNQNHEINILNFLIKNQNENENILTIKSVYENIYEYSRLV